jgi:protocatechuate 3,4-dioxygenase beta subunit
VAEEPHEHDRGLSYDLPTLLKRRHMVKLMIGAGLVPLIGCGDDDTDPASASTATGGDTIPEETAGPYPADGSNGVNVLDDAGIVRDDIRSSFGSASGVAEGVPLTVELTVVDAANGAVALEGAAVYLWHCDRDGAYSLYDESIIDENYLRGVQAADRDGLVRFTSIFPACYAGRWPHAHFEVYPSLDQATSAGTRLVTSQLAFPPEACAAAYTTEGYEQSVTNLSQVSLETDLVFSDGYELELATVTGDPDQGYTAALRVPV